MGLTREEIRASRADRKPVRVEVPEWGGDVFVRVMSARESLELTDVKDPSRMVFAVLIAGLVGEDGAQLFTEDDYTFLEEEPFPVVLRLFKDVARINGLPMGSTEDGEADFVPTPDASSSIG